MSEATTEAPVIAEEKLKKERSAAQLEALSKARVKAAEVRAKNTELRRKEREVVQAQLSENRRLREENIKREHAERFQRKDEATPPPPPPPNTPDDDEPEEEVVYEKKRPKKKRRVVVVQESSSEDEIEVQLPKQKRKPVSAEKKKPVSAEEDTDEVYQRAYRRMFEVF